MRRLPLRLGPLAAAGYSIMRSGVRWLCEDGHLCRPGEVIAFCNIALRPAGRRPHASDPFQSEIPDFQVAFAPRVGGRLRKSADSSRGGFIDQLAQFLQWTPDFVFAHIEHSGDDRFSDDGADGPLRLLLLAGRRTTELAEVRSGLLTGWHERSRAWWGEGDGDLGTVLSLGICDQQGIVRGEQFAFLEFFRAVPGPSQIVFIPDEALVPCARVTLERFSRTPQAFQAIATDFAQTFSAGSTVPSAKDWMFGATLLSALEHSPMTEEYDILTRSGLRRTGPANAVIMSLNAETRIVLRHRRLGYSVKCHDFRIMEAGPAVRAWLQSNFEPVKRTIDDIRRDYDALIESVRTRSNMQFLILNVMSTSGYEDFHNYAPFDRPMSDSLSSIRAKELNLMLHDLARDRGISIVDVDAIAAEIGAAAHIPDGVHNSGLMQAEVRGEILRILSALRIGGFRGPIN